MSHQGEQPEPAFVFGTGKDMMDLATQNYSNEFAGVMDAMTGMQFHQNQLPDLKEDSNPVIVFYKYVVK